MDKGRRNETKTQKRNFEGFKYETYYLGNLDGSFTDRPVRMHGCTWDAHVKQRDLAYFGWE